ncbi:MAG: protein kinase [Caldilineaceae bacterium]
MVGSYSTSDISIDLIEQVENQKCIVFAGPGVSIAPGNHVGPPGPALLAAELLLRLGFPINEYANEYSLPSIAQIYATKNEPLALRNYVAGRLQDQRYQPLVTHHLLAQLPFPIIVYTAQDALLQHAFRHQAVLAAHLLPDAPLNTPYERRVIHLYGTAEQPATLRLTDEERRQAFDRYPELQRFLLDRAQTLTPLFLGYDLNDRDFRAFYYDLRPRVEVNSPQACLVQATAHETDLKYWGERNAALLRMNPCAFLQQLRDQLAERGKALVNNAVPFAEPPEMNAAEQAARQQTKLAVSRLLGPGTPVESGRELAPVANRMAFMYRVITEDDPMNSGNEDETARQAASQTEDSTAQILLQQGNAEWVEGNHGRARELFEMAIRRDVQFIDAYFSLYYLLIEMGELDEAAGVYRRIIVRAPAQAIFPDRFQMQKILGQTDLGISYCVLDTQQGNLVTLTILRQALAQQPETLDNLGHAVGSIVSSHISHFLGAGRYAGRRYVLTEYTEGPTLAQWLQQRQQVAVAEAVTIFDQIAEALEDCERHGVPHLDLQPATVVLTADGAKLVNYGFYRLRTRQPNGWFTSGQRVSEYQGPEQRAQGKGDARSDIYALGTILYELLTGRHPGIGTYQSVSEINPEVDEATDLLIARARAFDPEQRFRSVTEMRREMQRISLSTGTPAQLLRIALARLSALYVAIATGKGALLLLLFALGVVVVSHVEALIALRAVSRVMLILIVTSVATALMGHYIVRETARREGLGSLIAGGRGMGASLGLLFAIYTLRITEWGAVNLLSADSIDFLNYVAVHLMVVILFTGLTFFIMQRLGKVVDMVWRRYTVGFYGTYLVIALLIALLAILGFPAGLITY